MVYLSLLSTHLQAVECQQRVARCFWFDECDGLAVANLRQFGLPTGQSELAVEGSGDIRMQQREPVAPDV